MERKQEHKDSEFLPKRGNPQHETVTYEIGGTFYEVSTSCGGSELLYSKDCSPAQSIAPTVEAICILPPARVLTVHKTIIAVQSTKSNTGSCTAHFIREETLKAIVRQRIFDVTARFIENIMDFREMVYQQQFAEAEKDMRRKRREVEQARKRIAELDRIFKRIYEGDINGTISHERFLKLSAEYEAEQKELTEKVKTEQQEVDTYEQSKMDFNSFATIIRKYVGITELTPTKVEIFLTSWEKSICLPSRRQNKKKPINRKRRHNP